MSRCTACSRMRGDNARCNAGSGHDLRSLSRSEGWHRATPPGRPPRRGVLEAELARAPPRARRAGAGAGTPPAAAGSCWSAGPWVSSPVAPSGTLRASGAWPAAYSAASLTSTSTAFSRLISVHRFGRAHRRWRHPSCAIAGHSSGGAGRQRRPERGTSCRGRSSRGARVRRAKSADSRIRAAFAQPTPLRRTRAMHNSSSSATANRPGTSRTASPAGPTCRSPPPA